MVTAKQGDKHHQALIHRELSYSSLEELNIEDGDEGTSWVIFDITTNEIANWAPQNQALLKAGFDCI